MNRHAIWSFLTLDPTAFHVRKSMQFASQKLPRKKWPNSFARPLYLKLFRSVAVQVKWMQYSIGNTNCEWCPLECHRIYIWRSRLPPVERSHTQHSNYEQTTNDIIDYKNKWWIGKHTENCLSPHADRPIMNVECTHAQWQSASTPVWGWKSFLCTLCQMAESLNSKVLTQV